jgi:Mce-associated membrane protein
MLDVSNGNRGAVTGPATEEEDGETAAATLESSPHPVAESGAARPPITAGAALRALVSAPGRWMRRRGRALVITLVLAGLIAALVSTDLKLRQQEAIGSARASGLTAAKTDAVELASYDYRRLDQDFGAVRQHSTPSFQASFSQSSSALASVLVKYHATATASVVSAGVVSASTGRAVVLVFLEQTVTNSTQRSGPQKDQSRVEMTLVRSHGRWLIDQVKLL